MISSPKSSWHLLFSMGLGLIIFCSSSLSESNAIDPLKVAYEALGASPRRSFSARLPYRYTKNFSNRNLVALNGLSQYEDRLAGAQEKLAIRAASLFTPETMVILAAIVAKKGKCDGKVRIPALEKKIACDYVKAFQIIQIERGKISGLFLR